MEKRNVKMAPVLCITTDAKVNLGRVVLGRNIAKMVVVLEGTTDVQKIPVSRTGNLNVAADESVSTRVKCVMVIKTVQMGMMRQIVQKRRMVN